MKKYEITEATCERCGHVLHRIRACRDFAGVKAGDLGGWVEGHHNLSQDGDAWIADDAMVYESAVVEDDALVKGHAVINGHAHVLGGAVIEDSAIVSDHAVVGGRAKVTGHSKVRDYATVTNAARVTEHAYVQGKARVSWWSTVAGEATVEGVVSDDAVITGTAVVPMNAMVYGKKVCLRDTSDILCLFLNGTHITFFRENGEIVCAIPSSPITQNVRMMEKEISKEAIMFAKAYFEKEV